MLILAYYGIQANTMTSCNEVSGELPAANYYPSIFATVNLTCEYKNTCTIKATTNAFQVAEAWSNPYNEQLLVQYQCVDAYGLNSTIDQCNQKKNVPTICPSLSTDVSLLEATACDTDNAPLNLTCPSGQTINVECAYYGLHPSITGCVLPANDVPVCYFASSFNNVTSICQGQQACSITFLNTFADPCNDMDKALYVQYKCKQKGS